MLFVVTSAVHAEEAAALDAHLGRVRDAPAPFTVHAYLENDGVLFKPNATSDRWYTSGIRLVFTHEPECAAAVGEWLDWFPLGGTGEARHGFGYAIGHKIFTPRHIQPSVPESNDRPYAGWLYGSFIFDRGNDTVTDRFEIDLGVVGPSAQGEQMQNAIHDIFGADDANGWDDQIGDEFGFDFLYTRKWKLVLNEPNGGGGFGAELIPSAGFVVGNVNRRLDAGALLRVGMNLPDDFGPGRVDDPVAAFGQWPKDFGFYGFVRVGGHVVEHDLFIQGNTWRDGSPSESKERLWGELQVGAFVYCHCLQIGYAQTFETRRFEDQDGAHGFGMWTISARFDF